MLKIVSRDGQEASSHRRIGFGHVLQALAFNKTNGAVDDGFGCEPMGISRGLLLGSVLSFLNI